MPTGLTKEAENAIKNKRSELAKSLWAKRKQEQEKFRHGLIDKINNSSSGVDQISKNGKFNTDLFKGQDYGYRSMDYDGNIIQNGRPWDYKGKSVIGKINDKELYKFGKQTMLDSSPMINRNSSYSRSIKNTNQEFENFMNDIKKKYGPSPKTSSNNQISTTPTVSKKESSRIGKNSLIAAGAVGTAGVGGYYLMKDNNK